MADDDLINDILLTGGAFDWITPTAAFVRDALAGPVSNFGILPGLWDRGDIRRLLNKHGVAVWGLIYSLSGDMLMFTVKEHQARWTDYVLRREGVPILYSPIEPPEIEGGSAGSFANDICFADLVIVENPSIWRWLGKQLLKLL